MTFKSSPHAFRGQFSLKILVIAFGIFSQMHLLAQTIRTVGTGGNFSTLQAAFIAINSGVLTGDIHLRIISSTTETASATLVGSGTGSANYAAVSIYPTVAGLTISGHIDAALINLFGSDNITIDGRVNATGNTTSLTIINTSTAAGLTSTIRFVNDASNNIVRYCNIRGSAGNPSSGIIFFSHSSLTTGNDNNTIAYNNISSSSDTSRPINAILSLSSEPWVNDNINIINNNIFNFLNPGFNSNGIFISYFTAGTTISGNSFYETTSFAPTAFVDYNAININCLNIGIHTITNNHIGGNAPLSGGTAWTKTNTSSNVFNAIRINVAPETNTTISGNTIRNINWSNSGSSPWTAINIIGGSTTVGSFGNGNVIGSATGTGSITVTNGTPAGVVTAIQFAFDGNVSCQFNTIGSISIGNIASNSTHFYGINKASGTGSVSINNNLIGSTSTINSINTTSASTANVQRVWGINSSGTGNTTISNNTIAN